MSDKCCIHCDSTVHKEGEEMEPMNIGGPCDAVETSVCRMNPDSGKASVVTEYHYKQCCSDINGNLLKSLQESKESYTF